MEIKSILKAMLICDYTMIEHGTFKRSLIGLFDNINASAFPTAHPAMSVYVLFREVEGRFDFTLELYDLNEAKSINKAVIRDYPVPHKQRDCELVFNLMNVRFPHAGEYEFRITINDLIFGQKYLRVSKKEDK